MAAQTPQSSPSRTSQVPLPLWAYAPATRYLVLSYAMLLPGFTPPSGSSLVPVVSALCDSRC
eukprot:3582682-Rhodomonas_salina.1